MIYFLLSLWEHKIDLSSRLKSESKSVHIMNLSLFIVGGSGWDFWLYVLF